MMWQWWECTVVVCCREKTCSSRFCRSCYLCIVESSGWCRYYYSLASRCWRRWYWGSTSRTLLHEWCRYWMTDHCFANGQSLLSKDLTPTRLIVDNLLCKIMKYYTASPANQPTQLYCLLCITNHSRSRCQHLLRLKTSALTAALAEILLPMLWVVRLLWLSCRERGSKILWEFLILVLVLCHTSLTLL